MLLFALSSKTRITPAKKFVDLLDGIDLLTRLLHRKDTLIYLQKQLDNNVLIGMFFPLESEPVR